MSIKLPFDLSKDAQAAVAILSAGGAIGAQLLTQLNGILPASWAAVITSVLAVVAGIAGFIEKSEPLIDEFDQS